MAEREFRLLTRAELTELYKTHMERDFPEAELKSLPRLLGLMDRGGYEPYGLFQDGELAAYALYWRVGEEPYVMLDYFAVVPEGRNKGTGSALLREIPDTGDEEVDALRRRRLGFYARAGLRQAGFRTKIFGVPFLVLRYGPEISDEALMGIARALYWDGVGDPALYEKNVLIPYDPEAV